MALHEVLVDVLTERHEEACAEAGFDFDGTDGFFASRASLLHPTEIRRH